MKFFDKISRYLMFPHGGDVGDDLRDVSRYSRMWWNTVIVIAAIALIPLIIMTAANDYQFRRTLKQEIIQPVHRQTATAKATMEAFLRQRISALRYIAQSESFESLCDAQQLSRVFKLLKRNFGEFLEISVIDGHGMVRASVGPYRNARNTRDERDVSDTIWFNKAYYREIFVSDVSRGEHGLNHFQVVIKNEESDNKEFLLEASIDIDEFNRALQAIGPVRDTDVFIINRDGVQQTPSRFFGAVFDRFLESAPVYSSEVEFVENLNLNETSYLMGYAYIPRSPFIAVVIAQNESLMKGWTTMRREFFLSLAAGVLVILFLIMRITSKWVARLRQSAFRRAANLRKIEHTSKMASIGRLAAGVAHEINNPLAIINENAGLLSDLIALGEKTIPADRASRAVGAITKSIQRCSRITHRLLGFAKHMDLEAERIDVEDLMHEVLTFLRQEATYRDIHVQLDACEKVPAIESDRGQLQQVFLNIINNAFDAMDDGGNLQIGIGSDDPEWVVVTITDDGMGMPREVMHRIFEPFFSTKKKEGTGLGLSISYGIVQKLGGKLSVDSELGMGTSFKVELPVRIKGHH